MRRVVLALMAAMALAGCMSTLQDVYDDRARDECDNSGDNGRAHADCYDRVDRNSRAHRDQ